MAERRMFSKSIVESARFLKMPVSSQLLYFHLGMNADDDGIVEAYTVINLVRAQEDDLRVLYSKGFVNILNEDLVTYITDWRQQNKIRPDRKKDSIYANLLMEVEPDIVLLEKKERSDIVKKSGPSMDNLWTTQCSAGKERILQERIEQCSVCMDHTEYILGKEVLSVHDYDALVNEYPRHIVDGVIKRILDKPYYGCLNMTTIAQWCAESNNNAKKRNQFQNCSQRSYNYTDLEKQLLVDKEI